MEIWHNPRCSKSRTAKAALDEAGVAYTERRYLDDPPTAAELDAVLTKIGAEPWEVARMTEAVAKELDLKNLERDRARWIEVMAANPVLIQRPIVVTDDGRAVVARDAESVGRALDSE
ncbi:arsenate reductase family protein [Spirillospora sp. CA-294931]|uniref:arsenate reductase family protein n=1 Tax=Spirillospora sp. CA-294931 TaxID=3240042 RepID=UPI003D8F1AE4